MGHSPAEALKERINTVLSLASAMTSHGDAATGKIESWSRAFRQPPQGTVQLDSPQYRKAAFIDPIVNSTENFAGLYLQICNAMLDLLRDDAGPEALDACLADNSGTIRLLRERVRKNVTRWLWATTPHSAERAVVWACCNLILMDTPPRDTVREIMRDADAAALLESIFLRNPVNLLKDRLAQAASLSECEEILHAVRRLMQRHIMEVVRSQAAFDHSIQST